MVTMRMASLAFSRGDEEGILERKSPVKPRIPMESKKPITALRSW